MLHINLSSNTRTTLLLLMVLIMFSCEQEKEIYMEFSKHSPIRLVIDGLITDQSQTHLIKLSKTIDTNSSDSTTFNTGASIEIVHNDINYPLLDLGNGVFQVPDDFNLQQNEHYYFSINNEELTYNYDVQTTKQIPISNAEIKPADYNPDFFVCSVELFSNPENQFEEKYFLMKLFFAQIIDTTTDTVWYEQTMVNHFTHAYSFTDTLRYELLNTDMVGVWDNTYKIEIHSIGKTVYDYLKTLQASDEYMNNMYSMSPPSNQFLFSEEAFGVIITSIVSSKVIKFNP